MWKKIKNFILKLFDRSDRIELATAIAKALKAFSDSTVDDILYYVIKAIVPSSSTVTDLVKSFLNNDLPVLLKALKLINASDETLIKETNINAVVAEIKTFGTIVDETKLIEAVTKALKDGKITLIEAKELLTNIKS